VSLYYPEPTYPPCPPVTKEVIDYLLWRLECCDLHARWSGSPLNSGVGAASVEYNRAVKERGRQQEGG
jgi:hypothetical protein